MSKTTDQGQRVDDPAAVTGDTPVRPEKDEQALREDMRRRRTARTPNFARPNKMLPRTCERSNLTTARTTPASRRAFTAPLTT